MSTFDRLIGNVQPYLDAIEKKRQRDTGMTYGQLRQFQAVGNTDSPTNQMSPNIVAPDKQNPAVTGMPAANTAPAQEAAPQLDSYDKMLQYLDAQRKVDANADRHAKAREMFAAIGDGISALSSMYQTTKGAPVTYTQGKDMTAVAQGRNDRMLAQRKADSDKYLNYLQAQARKEQHEQMNQYRMDQLEERKRANEANEQYRQEQLKIKQDADERKKKIDEARVRSYELRNNKAEIGQSEYLKAYADALERGYDEEHAKRIARQAQNEYDLAQKKELKASPGAPRSSSKSTKKVQKKSRGKTSSKSTGNKTQTKKESGNLGTNPSGL